MTRFESVEDVTEWLAPLGYGAFWRAVAPLNLFSESEQAHCDRTIAAGISPYDTVLSVMKGIVRMELTERYGLKYRLCIAPSPKLALVDETHLHEPAFIIRTHGQLAFTAEVSLRPCTPRYVQLM